LAARIDGERGAEYRDEIPGHQFYKRLDLLLHAIHSLSIGGFLTKTRLFPGLQNTYKKIRESKLEPFRE
jgi:hypothetical protein